jgi:hypothetical protein
MTRTSAIDRGFEWMLSTAVKRRGERVILAFAILSYLVHLTLIFLSQQGVLPMGSTFLTNPISAIYTPFSFILVYEVYLLIFFLPTSISFYIGKQYEIITLIVIRRIFKDIAEIELTSEWFHIQGDLQFTYDAVTSLLLFALLFFFYKEVKVRSAGHAVIPRTMDVSVSRFILVKKGIALLLVPVLLILAVSSFYLWIAATVSDQQNGLEAFKQLNNIFFDEFFSVLIVVDVLLLLVSFFYSDEFHTIIRNSGFVISTILIKMSFSVEGVVNNALVLGAVLFGFLILLIHNRYERSGIGDHS